jgi:hypothetical protein
MEKPNKFFFAMSLRAQHSADKTIKYRFGEENPVKIVDTTGLPRRAGALLAMTKQ